MPADTLPPETSVGTLLSTRLPMFSVQFRWLLGVYITSLVHRSKWPKTSRGISRYLQCKICRMIGDTRDKKHPHSHKKHLESYHFSVLSSKPSPCRVAKILGKLHRCRAVAVDAFYLVHRKDIRCHGGFGMNLSLFIKIYSLIGTVSSNDAIRF